MSKEKINNILNETAHLDAKEKGYSNADDYIKSIKSGLNSDNAVLSTKALKNAGDLITKLSTVLYQQKIEDNIGTSSVYGWVNKFAKTTLPWGNTKQLSQTVLTGAGSYDPNAWIPQSETKPQLNDTFLISFLKADGTNTTTAYKYKKSLTLQPHNWSYYFQNGKMEELISKIRADFNEAYEMFVAQRMQQLIKNLADGTAQTTIANGGENGTSLRLKTITSNAPDTFQAMLDLMTELDNLTNDVNKYTIANDSTNIRAVNKSELIIFVPKKLKSKFRSGVMSRLPSSGEFNYDKIFSTDNTFVSGLELNEVMANNGNTTAITIMDTPFLDETKIVVMEKDAIEHIHVVKALENQYYGENMNTQITNHSWGFFGINPFKRGFVFKCTNLLTDPN